MQWNIRRRKTRSERLRETSCCDEWRYGDVVIADLAIVFSETSGILDYCRENDITFFSYMVLEQGALSGKYDTRHPFPADSDRGAVYNPMLPQLEKLNGGLKEIADKHGVAVAQLPVAWEDLGEV